MNENTEQKSSDKLQSNGKPAPLEDRFSLKLLPLSKQLLSQVQRWFKLALRTLSSITNFFYQDGQDVEDGTITKDIRQAFTNFNFLNAAVCGGVLLVMLYLFSGIYVVNPGERAVVKLFGKPVNQGVEEGMHYRLPWPFQTVDIVNVSTIRREGIGLVLPEHKSIHSSPRVIQFLSGDNNIVDIQAVAQYRIKDATDYLYNVNYPAYQLINEVLRGSITEMGGSMNIDDILTKGKERLQEMIRIEAQSLLDQYRSGLQLVGINLNKVYPPEDVAESFRDVSNARQDQEKKINDAMGYRNTIIPQARGDAESIIRQSEGYRTTVVNKANGEAGRFEQMLTEYNKDRQKFTDDVTTTRLYLESMEKVLAKVKKYVVNPGKNGELKLNLMQR